LGTSDIIALSVIGAATSVVGTAQIHDPPQLKIGGRTVNAVFESMYGCVKTEIELVNNGEDRIARALTGILSTVGGNRDSFVAARPALAGATHETVTNLMGWSS
jgi:hypothetical protein